MEPSLGEEVISPNTKRARVRVSKACDECRYRKVRCDGKQPCKACNASDRRCSYDSSRARRHRGSGWTKTVEDRLCRARAYIEELHSKLPASSRRDLDFLLGSPGHSPSRSPELGSPGTEGRQSPKLQNLIGRQGHIFSTNGKKGEFFGGFSGLSFLLKTNNYFNESEEGPGQTSPSHPIHTAITGLFDSPLPEKQSLDLDVPMSHLMPSRHTVSELLHVVFGGAYPLFQFIHVPTFQERTDRIYKLEPIEYEDCDHEFLPLFYVVVGLGYLFSARHHQKHGCAGAMSQAMRHFIATREMVDFPRCRGLVSLQILICIVLFLTSTARLATSHTYTGLAVTAAFSLGLHCHVSAEETYSALELDMRSRVFLTIVKLDMYCSSVLGLPALINLQELDHLDMPHGADDLLSLGQPQPIRENALVAASTKHFEILRITANAVKCLYPRLDSNRREESRQRTILVSNRKLMELEHDLQQWRQGLFDLTSDDSDNCVVKSMKYQLEMAYSYGHIVLYRPFLHYLPRMVTEEPPDERQVRYALACVKVAQYTISHSEAVLQQGILYAASWHSIYTIFLSVIVMIFFLATQKGAQGYEVVQQSTESGIRILASTSCQDTGSRRCLDVIRALVTKVSHAITLDIDGIQSDAKSLCHSSPDVRELKANGKRSDFDRPTDPTVHVTSLFQEPYRAANLDEFSNSVKTPLVPLYLQSEQSATSTSAFPFFVGRSLHFQPNDQAQPQITVADDIEIPFTYNFASPMHAYQRNQSLQDGGTDAQGFEGEPWQTPLTAEDIAAFMQINPAEGPFP